MPFDSLPTNDEVYRPITSDEILRLEQMYCLLEKGWCQEVEVSIGHDSVRYCLIGAAKHVQLDIYHLANMMGYQNSGPYWISRWNDSPKRTHKQVLNRVKKVIDREREKLLESNINNKYPVIET